MIRAAAGVSPCGWARLRGVLADPLNSHACTAQDEGGEAGTPLRWLVSHDKGEGTTPTPTPATTTGWEGCGWGTRHGGGAGQDGSMRNGRGLRGKRHKFDLRAKLFYKLNSF